MRKIWISFLLLFLSLQTSSAQEIDSEEVFSEEAYFFPEIKPQLSVSGGYRFVHSSGSAKVDEHEYLHNSLSFGSEARFFSFPHRLYLDIDLKNKNDYFGELNYAYKDLVVLKGLNRTLYHNLDSIRLFDLDPNTLWSAVYMDNTDDEYGVKAAMTNLFLRFKTPDFPFHVYMDWKFLERKGSQQQRALLGSGYYNNLIRTVHRREIDWQTENMTVGANSHLGVVEVDFSHSEKRFDAKEDRIIYDIYGPAGFNPVNFIRQGGVYPHNNTPGMKGSSNTLKMHSSYTGGLVASATLSNMSRENNYSGAKTEYFIGAGEITWIPFTRLAVFIKYRHKETDIDNPDSVTITDISGAGNSYTYKIKPSVSSSTSNFSGTVRYKPFSLLTLRADYAHDIIKRDNSAEWRLPESTYRNTFSVAADAKISKGLHIKGKFSHKETDHPAYNIEPDRSDEGKVSVTWIPAGRINTLLSYSISRQDREDLYFVDSSGNSIEGNEKREVRQDKLLGSVTFLIGRNLSMTTSYSYMHNRIKQDLLSYSSNPPFTGISDFFIPHKDKIHNYSVDFTYSPKNSMSYSAGISHTISKGMCYAGNSEFESLALFSDLKIKETVFQAAVEYRFKNGLLAGISYKHIDFNDVIDNPYDDVNDGRANLILVKISKRW